MRVSLPVVFVLQTALLIGAMVGIITSFVVVTNTSIETVVQNSIENNLNTFAESVTTIMQETEPAAKQCGLLAHATWNESGSRKNTPGFDTIADFNRSMSVFVSHMALNAKFVYVYESFEIPGSGGRFGELSCGVADGLFFCSSTNRSNFDEYIEGPGLPLDLTVADEYDNDVTDEEYTQVIRNMSAAAGHNTTGLWHPPGVWYDPITNETRALMTYSVPTMFDATDGHTTSAYSVDVDVKVMSAQLRALAKQNNLLYLIDVPTLSLIVSSKRTAEVPVINYADNPDGAWYVVPDTATPEINRAMRLVLESAGGQEGLSAASGYHVLDMDDTVVSYRHIRRGTLHWITVDHTPRDFYFGEARRVRTILIVVAVIVLSICLAVCVVVYMAVVRPITNLAIAMDRISRLEVTTDEAREPPSLSELQPMHDAFIKLDVALQSFTRYVPRGVVKELIESNQLCQLVMLPRKCTILFSDIAGFTSISERVPAAQLSELVHTYFNRMSRIVMEHNGMIDKFIGDCIMAVWGAPLPQEHHELRATLAGMLLEREARSDPLATDFDEVGEMLSIRVGVNSGDVLAGNMGSDERMNYTVIGDNVNLSSRLEAFNKMMGTRTMVSGGTAEGLQGKVVLRLLCRVAVMGKDLPVEVFEARGLDGSRSTKLLAVDTMVMEMDSSVSLRQLRGAAGGGSDANIAMEVRGTGSGSWGSGSEMTIVSGDDDLMREHKASSLLKAARGKIVCDVKEVEFAAKYSEAVRLFMRNECGEALQRVAGLKAQYPQWMNDLAAEYLEKSATAQLREPRKDFDGVYRQTEKA